MADFNPQNLAIFMLAATQADYIKDLLPETGDATFGNNNNFARLGVDQTALRDFVLKFGGAKAAENRAKFLAVAELAADMVDYHPPDCPDTATLSKVVKASK